MHWYTITPRQSWWDKVSCSTNEKTHGKSAMDAHN